MTADTPADTTRQPRLPKRALGPNNPQGPQYASGWVYTQQARYILWLVGKHLIDLDEELLSAARAELGTDTIKATVNSALEAACASRVERVSAALDVLANFQFEDRERAWR